jgi:hypothetical protein
MNPAFQSTPEELLGLWEKGYRDAHKYEDYRRAFRFATRVIARDDSAPSGVHDASTLTMLHPKFEAYVRGFNAYKKLLQPDEISQSKAIISSAEFTNPQRITFEGVLKRPLRFQEGSITGVKNPDLFKDVKVMMIVGDRRYEPIQQPGDLPARRVPEEYIYWVDVPFYYGFRGWYPYGWPSPLLPYDPFISEQRRGIYKYQATDFKVIFDLYDPDGTPRVTSRDESLTVVVSYPGKRVEANFKLEKWLRSFE